LHLSQIKYRIFVLLSFFVLTAHLSNLSAQWESPPNGRAGTPSEQDSKSIVTGKISDAETGNPLENVIVFLTQTPFGSSSGKDGKFRIANVPNGDYEMIISRVGYERQIITLQISKPESLYYEIKLRPQPVRTGEVEVLAERPDAMKPNLNLFFPEAKDDAYCLYGSDASLPIGILFTDSAFYMYALETANVDSEKYIKLWLLYKNLSEQPYELNPMTCIRLHVLGKDRSYNHIQPEPLSTMSNFVTKEKAVKEIYERIGETFQTLLLFQILIRPGILRSGGGVPIDAKQGTNADMSGKMQIQWNFEKDPVLMGTSTEFLSTIFSASINDGILDRHIVYPNNSVNGYVYFPFPGLNWKTTETWIYDAAKYEYELEIITPNGSRKIAFIPN